MGNNAEHINDIRTEVVKDVYLTCKITRVRIAKIVEVRSYANKMEDLEALLEVLDFLDKKIDSFKAKYIKLRTKEEKRLKAAKDAKVTPSCNLQPIKQPEQEDANEEGEESDLEDFDAEGEDEGEGEEIGNINLLDLGLGEEPPKKKKSKKSKKAKKNKKEKKKPKSSDDEDSKEESEKHKSDEESENMDPKDKNKTIKKLMAPPSCSRKLQSANSAGVHTENQLEGKKQEEFMDLLDF